MPWYAFRRRCKERYRPCAEAGEVGRELLGTTESGYRMWAVSVVHTDDSLRWQRRLRSISSVEISIDPRGLKYLCRRDVFSRVGRILDSLPPGLVFLGSGSFHHLSYHLVRRHASEPLGLVVFDGHGDLLPAPEGHVSCGSWLAEALELPGIQAVALVGPEGRSELPRKVLWAPPESAEQVIAEVSATTRRVYVSIDKDVLAEASTDWGSGKLAVTALLGLLLRLCGRCELVGADVCGEIVPRGAWATDLEFRGIRRNEDLNLILCSMLSGLRGQARSSA